MATPARYGSTLAALGTLSRALPIAVVGFGVAAVELLMLESVAAAAVDLALVGLFVFVAPWLWRLLCSPRVASIRNRTLGYIAYLALISLLVGAAGSTLPLLALGHWTYVTAPPSLAVVLILFAVGGWGLGRDIDLEEGYTEERQRAETMSAEAERAQLLALRAHLDPHFLFNTLNAISEWIREDAETAERATLQLADLLRLITTGVRAPSWPLAREIELLELLFDLYRVRDSERFRFEVTLPESIPELEIPPMLLLPLAENAIKHGPAAGHDGPLRLTLSEADERVRIELRNPGAFTGPRAGGEGIRMVTKRLELCYEDVELVLRKEGEQTLTRLDLPRALTRTEERARS